MDIETSHLSSHLAIECCLWWLCTETLCRQSWKSHAQSSLLVLFHRHFSAPKMFLPSPSDGKAMCFLYVLPQATFPPNGLSSWLTALLTFSSSKAAVFIKQEEGNLDNILQGDRWLHCLVIQLQHEAEQLLQGLTQFSLHLAVDSPVQGFIDHHSQVLQQLQTEAKEAVQHQVLWMTCTALTSQPWGALCCPHSWAQRSGWEGLQKQLGAHQVTWNTPQISYFTLLKDLSSTSKWSVTRTKSLWAIPGYTASVHIVSHTLCFNWVHS